MVGCCPFSFYVEGKEVTPMMEYLLSLLQDLLKVFLTILVTGYGNKLVSNISKKRKRTSLRRRKQKGSSRKRK
ncbi:uncharacterized protein pE33L466_0424 (plasmid) [Bacillus cereus E33L]|uniref:Uncharacterized protein n=3 Tax=Bacillaceae TaxID=186817 RepID=Q4V145_BACCZ|nr:uncharacterized protein pE33L466_0424 [Bacillus cereus E33L]